MTAPAATAACWFTVTWHGGLPEERKYRRSAAEHDGVWSGCIATPAGTYDLYTCKRCGKEV